MPGESSYRMTVPKARLQRDFHHLRRALQDYGALLAAAQPPPDAASADGAWQEEAVRLLRRQHLSLLQARVSPGNGELVLKLLRTVLGRVALPALRFRARNGNAAGHRASAGPAPGEAAAGPHLPERVAALLTLAESAPLELQDKLRGTLAGVLEAFAALGEAAPERLETALARINLATASAPSRSLLREIALVTREVYSELQAASAELPLEALSENAGGITEAVRKLNSVMARLDAAATENLDHLERVEHISAGEAAALEGVMETLRVAQARLMGLKTAHPDHSGALAAVQDRLSDAVGAPVMGLWQYQSGASAEHMELISNQSFQELSGRTLRKIIGFVESLEGQLDAVFRPYRAHAGLAVSAAAPIPDADEPPSTPQGLAEPTPAGVRASQSDVDKLLGDLGF